MSDKAFILLLVVLVSMGIYSYQKALRERGGVLPLEELLGQRPDKEEEGRFWSSKVDALNLQQRIKNLRSALEEDGRRKDELLERRRQYLNALLESNWRIYRLAKADLDAVLEEYKRVQEPYELIKTTATEIIRLSEMANLEYRQKTFAEKEAVLVGAVNMIMPLRPDSLINDILTDTAIILTEPFDPRAWGCASMTACIEKNMAAVEREIGSYLEARVSLTMRQLEDVIELNRILEHEYKFLQLNTEGTDGQTAEDSRVLAEALEKTLQHLDELNFKDFAVLLKRLDLNERELDAALSNLNEHHAHFERRVRDGLRMQELIIAHLQRSGAYDFDQLAGSFAEVMPANERSLRLIKEESPLLLDLLSRSVRVDEETIESMAGHHKIDLTALGAELGLAKYADDMAVAPPRKSWQAAATPAGESSGVRTDEQMQLMREKAQRDDETLKRMFAIYGAQLE